MYTNALTDNELVACYQKDGDSEAMGMLYLRYAPLVFGLCYKYLHCETRSKDAVSEIFLIVLEKAREHEIYSFRHWLYAVSRNYLFSKNRRSGNLVAEPVDNILEKFMEKPPDLTLYVQERLRHHLERALSRLDDDQRNCVELFYMREVSYKEISAATGLELNQVKSCIQNGMRNLKIYFGENHIPYEPGRS